MDDLLIWDGRGEEVQARFAAVQKGFVKWGLAINHGKCALYVSPKHEGPRHIKLGDITIAAQDNMPVMGVESKVGSNVQELLKPTGSGGPTSSGGSATYSKAKLPSATESGCSIGSWGIRFFGMLRPLLQNPHHCKQ